MAGVSGALGSGILVAMRVGLSYYAGPHYIVARHSMSTAKLERRSAELTWSSTPASFNSPYDDGRSPEHSQIGCATRANASGFLGWRGFLASGGGGDWLAELFCGGGWIWA